MIALKKRNDVLQVNPTVFNGVSPQIHITTRGSDLYWAWTAIFAFSSLSFLVIAFLKPSQKRLFAYILAGITLVATISNFTMASNLGWVPIGVEWHRNNHRVAGDLRQIFYVRYIDWFITSPLVLVSLLLTAGTGPATILIFVLFDWVATVSLLVGALVNTTYKWGYFTLGLVSLLYVLYFVIFEARRNAVALGTDINRVYTAGSALIATIWILYPIAWGVSEGGNVIAPDSEAIFYGILDIFTKVVFGALLLWGHRNIDPAQLGLALNDYTAIPASRGPSHEEKRELNGQSGANATPEPATV